MGSLGVLRVQNRLLRIWHAQNTRSQCPTTVFPLPSELAPGAIGRMSSEGHHQIEIEHRHRCLQDSPHRMVHLEDILQFGPSKEAHVIVQEVALPTSPMWSIRVYVAFIWTLPLGFLYSCSTSFNSIALVVL